MTNVHPLFVSIFRAYGVAPTEDEEEIMETSSPAEERSTVPTCKSGVAPFGVFGRDPHVCDAKGNPHTFIQHKNEFVCVDCGAIFDEEESEQ